MSTRPTSNFSIRAETLSAVVPALGVVYVEAAVAPTVSGALGLTLDAVTLVATDAVKVQGTLTKTLAAVTLAAPGAVKIQGALTEALAPLAITATVHVFGAVLRATLAKVRLNAVGTARSYSPIVRRQDWPTVLANMVAAAYCEPFAWGTHDCCIWAADVIQAMSENHVDLAASYRGTYSDEAGAAAVISAATGGGDLEDLIESIATANGFLEVTPNKAQRGDLALADTVTGPAAGIIGPDGRTGLFVALDGLMLLSLTSIRRTWRI